jgi:hypothetical protein
MSNEREAVLNAAGLLRIELNRRLRAGELLTDLLPSYQKLCGRIKELDKAAALPSDRVRSDPDGANEPRRRTVKQTTPDRMPGNLKP